MDVQARNYIYFLQKNYDGSDSAYGGRRYFVYDYRAGMGMANLIYAKSHNDLFYDPKMCQVAMSLFINTFDNPTTFGEVLDVGGNDDIAFQWVTTGGTPYVILMTDDDDEPITTPALLYRQITTTNNYTAYDMMWNEIATATNVFTYSDFPIFITPSGATTKAQMKTDFEAASVINATDSTAPNIALLQAPRGAITAGEIYRVRATAADNASRNVGGCDREEAGWPDCPGGYVRIFYSFKTTGDIGNNDWSDWSESHYIDYTASSSGSDFQIYARAKDADDNLREIVILSPGGLPGASLGINTNYNSGGMNFNYNSGGINIK
jgi:hypothetical protein